MVYIGSGVNYFAPMCAPTAGDDDSLSRVRDVSLQLILFFLRAETLLEHIRPVRLGVTAVEQRVDAGVAH